MHKLKFFLFLFCSFLICNSAASAATIEVSSTIKSIEIKGNLAVPETKIKPVIFSRQGEALVETKLRADAKAIYGLGFFKDVNVTFEVEKSGTKVIFLVEENPLIEEIVINGNNVYSSQEIKAEIKNQENSVLNFKLLQADIERVNQKYKDAGYILARVTDVDIDEKSGTLTFIIIEGKVESISLTGNKNTKDYVILRELKTAPGQVLNQKVLKKDLRRIFNLGYFANVTPNFEAGSNPNNVALVINIKEKRTSTINFGGGYGEREGWFGFVDLSVNNLFGTAQNVLIRGQAGQQLSSYQLKYNNPWFFPERFGPRTSFTARRWYTLGRDIYLSDQDARYNGFDFSIGKPIINEDFKIVWTFGSEHVSPYNTATFEAYKADTVGVTLNYDTRDYWLNPTKGKYYSFSAKQGWKTADSGSSNFFKLGTDLNNYYPLWENQVLASHFGTGIGFGDIPIGEEYWIGGANTVRGYYPGEARKGSRKLILNLEYRLTFSDLFQAVFFYDWGNAWNAGAPDPSQFITGWGPGVRVTTPLGPIRLDYGIAGHKTFSEGVMHFSIGQAF